MVQEKMIALPQASDFFQKFSRALSSQNAGSAMEFYRFMTLALEATPRDRIAHILWRHS
jgi:hypothetical protein